jgi:phosphate transport system substrate-binding protein
MEGRGKAAIGLVLVAMWMAPTAVAVAAGKVQIQIEGSTTVGPIADAFAEALHSSRNDISITVKKTGSGHGAAALVDGRCDIATMSRFMKGKEFKDAVAKDVMPVAHVVAMDGVCIIVHPSNPVSGLTREQIRKMYTGEIGNWSEVGGPNRPIVRINRDSASGTFETFEKLVMSKQKAAGDVETVNSNPQMYNRVKSTTGAIGYVGLGFLNSSVKALKVDGVAPSRRTIASGVYPVSRPLFLFTNGYPKLGSGVHVFCTFHLSEKGQMLVEEKGFVPVTDY